MPGKAAQVQEPEPVQGRPAKSRWAWRSTSALAACSSASSTATSALRQRASDENRSPWNRIASRSSPSRPCIQRIVTSRACSNR